MATIKIITAAMVFQLINGIGANSRTSAISNAIPTCFRFSLFLAMSITTFLGRQ
jgi:hypothetical protein